MAIANEKRRALGKGLESLLPSRPAAQTVSVAAAAAEETMKAEVRGTGRPLEIPLGQIRRNPYQTRTHFREEALQELAASIKATGVVQPVVVRALGNDEYQLIMGERRWLASYEAGKETIPAIVREVPDVVAMEMTIVENLQRENLNPMEQARAFRRLGDEFRMTQEQMAVRTGKERASVTNFLRLLKLPEAVQEKVETGELTFGHARALLALETEEEMLAAAQKVMALSMSVRQTESYVQGLLYPELREKKQKDEIARDANAIDAERRLRERLGLRVKVEHAAGNPNKGKVIVEYGSVEEFGALLEALGA